MSHFSVLVIGNNVEEQLAPYNVEGQLVPYSEEKASNETHILHTKEELIKVGREDILNYAETMYSIYLENPELYLEHCGGDPENAHFKYISEKFPEQLNWTDEQIYQEAIKYYNEDEIDSKGNVVVDWNIHGKWDWYVIGGRWKNMLKLKNSDTWYQIFLKNSYTFVDSAKKKDIDWQGMRLAQYERLHELFDKYEKELASELEDNVKQKYIEEWKSNKVIQLYDKTRNFRLARIQEEFSTIDEYIHYMRVFYSGAIILGEFQFGKEMTREQLLRDRGGLHFDALVKDGEWYECGKMLMFGQSKPKMSKEEWENLIMKKLDETDDEEYITVVDCHV